MHPRKLQEVRRTQWAACMSQPVCGDGTVAVTANLRVHVNSLDLSGTGPRTSGGVGFALASEHITVVASRAEADHVSGPLGPACAAVLRGLREREPTRFRHHFRLQTSASATPHSGLGTTTQAQCAAIEALLQLECGRAAGFEDLVAAGIGEMSAIGLRCFLDGGFVVDLGSCAGADVRVREDPLLRGRALSPTGRICLPFPHDWRVLLVQPVEATSLDGADEDNFWMTVIPTPRRDATEAAYWTLLGIIPAILERDRAAFLGALAGLCSVGAKPAELAIQGPLTLAALDEVRAATGFAGLSSLGPTVYGFPDPGFSDADLCALQRRHPGHRITLTQVAQRSRSGSPCPG